MRGLPGEGRTAGAEQGNTEKKQHIHNLSILNYTYLAYEVENVCRICQRHSSRLMSNNDKLISHVDMIKIYFLTT